jgi:DNA helicase INO80
MKERIEQIYEKRYGTRMPKSDVFKKRSKQYKQIKKFKYHHRHNSDGDTTDTETFDTEEGRKLSSERKVEDERQKIWLTIARKDIPRVSLIFNKPCNACTYIYRSLIDDSYLVACSSNSIWKL